LVAGSVITISAKEQYPASFEGQNGQKLSIKLNDCNLDYVVSSGQQSSAPQSSAPQSSAPQAPKAKDFSKEIDAYWAMASDQARQAHWGRLSQDVKDAIMAANS